MRGSLAESGERECSACEVLMAEMVEIRGRHVLRVEECDKLSANHERVERAC